jgi:hypothetical protein
MIKIENGGIVVAQRKDGSRCILWENNSLEWFSKDDANRLFGI